MSKILDVKTIEPAALSPKSTCAYLSLSKRTIFTLIADGKLLAKTCGGRTLVDYVSARAFYDALPVKTASALIPNAPKGRRRRRRAA